MVNRHLPGGPGEVARDHLAIDGIGDGDRSAPGVASLQAFGAEGADVATVQALLTAGAEVDVKGEHEDTPLLRAPSAGDDAIVDVLREAGATD